LQLKGSQKTNSVTLAKSELRGEIFGALYFQRKPSDCNGCGISAKLKQDRKTAGQTRLVGEILEILEILQGMKCAISGSILQLIHLAK